MFAFIGKFSIQLEPNDTTVKDIKSKIYDHVNIAPDKQHLGLNGILLDDGGNLKEYGIQRDVTLHFATCLHDASMEIDIKTPNGRLFKEYMPVSLIESLKVII